MLDTVLDVHLLKDGFGLVTRARDLGGEALRDVAFLNLLRRTTMGVGGGEPRPLRRSPFPPVTPRPVPRLVGRRVAVVASGGSGALASVVGVARALEELDLTPVAYALCSGSALFGFPLATGMSADAVAEAVLALEPSDYVDPDWGRLARLPFTLGRGFGGVMRGEALEEAFHGIVGDITLGELPIPAYAPIWSVEENRVAYIGPDTHPDLPVARAIRLAVAIPLFFQPVELDGESWCDGGIVDIFPAPPVLAMDPLPDVVVGVNGFYPPHFAGESQAGWAQQRLSILGVASQVRTSQHLGLARELVRQLRRDVAEVHVLQPVPYTVVKGTGFYRQFLDSTDWPEFMRDGRRSTLKALRA